MFLSIKYSFALSLCASLLCTTAAEAQTSLGAGGPNVALSKSRGGPNEEPLAVHEQIWYSLTTLTQLEDVKPGDGQYVLENKLGLDRTTAAQLLTMVRELDTSKKERSKQQLVALCNNRISLASSAIKTANALSDLDSDEADEVRRSGDKIMLSVGGDVYQKLMTWALSKDAPVIHVSNIDWSKRFSTEDAHLQFLSRMCDSK
jgi:hypothetical protein